MKKILIVMSVAAGLASCRPQNPDVPAVREFIRNNWHTTVQHCTTDTATLIGLPHPYTVPTAGAMFREMYYWDTFFTNEGLVRDAIPSWPKVIPTTCSIWFAVSARSTTAAELITKRGRRRPISP